jgi:hypothetical protein
MMARGTDKRSKFVLCVLICVSGDNRYENIMMSESRWKEIVMRMGISTYPDTANAATYSSCKAGSSQSAALSRSWQCSRSSQSRCSTDSGSFMATGIEILERFLPMFFFKIPQMDASFAACVFFTGSEVRGGMPLLSSSS